MTYKIPTFFKARVPGSGNPKYNYCKLQQHNVKNVTIIKLHNC
jgi:hypothetical protein